jgi:hypothetical protein
MGWLSTSRDSSCGLALALACCSYVLPARAHVPEARGLAVSATGDALAVTLPGFGIAYRAAPTQPFAYICNSLLFSRLTDGTPTVVLHADGSLLVGGAAGMRSLSADGCPLPASELSDASVVALAAQPGATQNVYALVAGENAGLWRSLDGGLHWQLRSTISAPDSVTALVVSPDNPDHIYLSAKTSLAAFVWSSSDGGTTLVSHAQDVARTLLAVQGASEQLWARARDAQSAGNAGAAILRAPSPDGPWLPLTRVEYFGGFVIDAAGVISVGDEIAGVYRSHDDGRTFRQLEPDARVSCLAAAGDTLWAGTTGVLRDPALQSMAPGQPFAGELALTDVQQLVSCRAELNVERVCASAWIEWQRDVLMRAVQLPDAGQPAAAVDAGADEPADADAGQAQPEDAAVSVDASPAARRTSSGCSALPYAPDTRQPLSWLALALCALWARVSRLRRGS